MKGDSKARSSPTAAGNTRRMNDLRNKIMNFRDLLDLSPCITSATVSQVSIYLSIFLSFFPSFFFFLPAINNSAWALKKYYSSQFLQLMIWTLKDVCRSYAIARPSILMSELERSSTFQVKYIPFFLLHIYNQNYIYIYN